MTILVGAAASAAVRYLLSVNLGPRFGLTNQQALVFNVLDMTISSIACYVLARMGKNENVQLLIGRGLGFLASATITSLAVGPVNLVVSLVVSGVSQFVGMFVNVGMGNSNDMLGLI
jgi:hypothetical protein